MSNFSSQIESSSTPPSHQYKELPVVGVVEEWEQKILHDLRDPTQLGKQCLNIAELQTSFHRVMQWVQLGVWADCEHSIVLYTALVYASTPDIEYKVDEVALMLSRVKDKRLLRESGAFDPHFFHARRGIVRTLLSGSLKKNNQSHLYTSFFRSSMTETHLLPLISKYLVPIKREVSHSHHYNTTPTHLYMSGWRDISRLFLLNDLSRVSCLSIPMKTNNYMMCFLPLFLSHCPALKRIIFELPYVPRGSPKTFEVDLSLLTRVDTSKLEQLMFSNCSALSLSPLSHCDLSSLQSLILGFGSPSTFSLQSLEGLTNRNTSALEKLELSCLRLNDISALSSCNLSHLKKLQFFQCRDLSNLSPLSDRDLPSLEVLSLNGCRSLTDLSPLRGKDLSSLKHLHLQCTNVSDLSPLCESKAFAPHTLNLHSTPIDDLSSLSQLDLSQLTSVLVMCNTQVLDLSPLETIPYPGVVLDIRSTPAAIRFVEEGLKSPQTIGNVKVQF